MPFEKSYDSQPTGEPACIHLRSKAMYVMGECKPAHPDEAGSNYCWCNKTQHIVGPDKRHVEREQCVPGRMCFAESYDV